MSLQPIVKRAAAFAIVGALTLAASPARFTTQTTGPAGGGQPHENQQPGLRAWSLGEKYSVEEVTLTRRRARNQDDACVAALGSSISSSLSSRALIAPRDRPCESANCL